MTELITDFVDFIEYNIYQNELIYRSIIIANDIEEIGIIKNLFETNNHNVVIFKEDELNINYDMIDNRVVLMTKKHFVAFLEFGQFSSFNFIGISYTIDDEDVETLIQSFYEKTNNNIDNTIILSKNKSKKPKR
jgi:hypothetical protein